MFGFGGGDKKEDDKKEDQAAQNAGGGADGSGVDKNAPSGQKVGKMSGGDYLVHVLIQSAKNLTLDGEDTCDPFIKVNLLNQEKQSTCKKDITQIGKVVYDEHMFIELKNVSKEEIEASEISFSIQNKGFFKGDEIGQFSVSTSKIYFQKNHSMQHQQFGMNNPNSSDFSKITGYVAISVNV